MRNKVKLDLRGLEDVGRSAAVRNKIEEYAERVADNIRAQGIRVEGVPGEAALPVDVRHGDAQGMRVGRARSTVTLAHAAGKAVQAKHGALTKAAAQLGLRLSTDGSPNDLIEYTTKAGVKRMATRAQVAAWTRGRG